jgi:hypothetical protein
LGLERYAAAFRDNDIDDAVLQRLTAEDLRELGIASVGHRRRLLDAIAALALTPAVNASGLPAKTISLWCSGDCRRQPSPASWFRLTPLYDVMSAQPNVDAGEIRRNALPSGTDDVFDRADCRRAGLGEAISRIGLH